MAFSSAVQLFQEFSPSVLTGFAAGATAGRGHGRGRGGRDRGLRGGHLPLFLLLHLLHLRLLLLLQRVELLLRRELMRRRPRRRRCNLQLLRLLELRLKMRRGRHVGRRALGRLHAHRHAVRSHVHRPAPAGGLLKRAERRC